MNNLTILILFYNNLETSDHIPPQFGQPSVLPQLLFSQEKPFPPQSYKSKKFFFMMTINLFKIGNNLLIYLGNKDKVNLTT